MYNHWLHRVVPVHGREARFQWAAWQGADQAWRATLTVRPRVWCHDWEKPTTFTGSPALTKRDAREDVCRRLLEEQNRWGRVPHLTAPTPLAALVARAPGQGGAGQPAAGSAGGQAADALPRPLRVVPYAKTPPGTPRAPQQDAPVPPPAADQDPRVGGLPQGAGAGDPDTDRQDAAPPGTGPAPGGPGPDDPGALVANLLLAETSPAARADAPAD